MRLPAPDEGHAVTGAGAVHVVGDDVRATIHAIHRGAVDAIEERGSSSLPD